MFHVKRNTFCLVVALSAVAGCSNQPAVDASSATSTASRVAGAGSGGDAAGAAGPAATAGATASASMQSGVETVSGTVVETMDAASYTYVRVDAGSREIWAAASQFPVKVGDRVVVPLEMPMENFHSKALNRDFPVVYFASAITREGETSAPAMAAAHPPAGEQAPMAGHPPAKSTAALTEPVAPAEGGVTVAKVWAERASLKGQTITVRGRVVKVNSGILDRNWLHIQDGTGKVDDGSHDLTVTTAGTAKVGDIVTVTGRLAVDKDLGAGYAYKVIIEDATIKPQ